MIILIRGTLSVLISVHYCYRYHYTIGTNLSTLSVRISEHYRYTIGTLLVRYWYTIGILSLWWIDISTLSVLISGTIGTHFGTLLVKYWYTIGTLSVHYWYTISTDIVLISAHQHTIATQSGWRGTLSELILVHSRYTVSLVFALISVHYRYWYRHAINSLDIGYWLSGTDIGTQSVQYRHTISILSVNNRHTISTLSGIDIFSTLLTFSFFDVSMVCNVTVCCINVAIL